MLPRGLVFNEGCHLWQIPWYRGTPLFQTILKEKSKKRDSPWWRVHLHRNTKRTVLKKKGGGGLRKRESLLSWRFQKKMSQMKGGLCTVDVLIVWRLGPDGWKGSIMNSMATCSTWREMGSIRFCTLPLTHHVSWQTTTKKEVGSQHQGMDRSGVCQVPEGSGKQKKTEENGCEVICGVPTTSAVKG